MEAQAVARDQHLARWKCVFIRFEFLALIMVVMLLVGSRVYTFDNPADDTHVSIYILRDCCMATVSLIL